MHVQTGQAAELQERRIAIEQAGHALTWQQLAALLELLALGFGFGDDDLLKATSPTAHREAETAKAHRG